MPTWETNTNELLAGSLSQHCDLLSLHCLIFNAHAHKFKPDLFPKIIKSKI